MTNTRANGLALGAAEWRKLVRYEQSGYVTELTFMRRECLGPLNVVTSQYGMLRSAFDQARRYLHEIDDVLADME